ncbi:serpin family protein [Argonema antarcticum]|uniref:serpin family protein n=1 Tax=Argonema antarcticum TaxID=2942763 RepID=UPI0020127FE4|nr:serpin family protein [Argonema antarcticum A004/B2]
MKIRHTLILATSICLLILGESGILRAGQRGRGAEGQRGRGAEEQRGRGAEEQRGRGAEGQNKPFTSSQSLTKNFQSPNDVNPKLIEANTRFSFKLFSEILKKEGNENIFISPASIAIALSITYNGASGKTQQAIAQTLELQGISLQEVNQANAALKASLINPDPKVQLTIANSLWAKDGEPLKPEFIRKIHELYGSKVQNLNFSDPTVVSIINDWVKQSSNGKIDKIIDSIEPDSVFVLLNAIHFLGTWTYPFPKQATQERQFTLLNGTQKLHPLMFQQISGAKYYENDMFQAISLPYGEKRFSMYIFLPKKGVRIKTFYESLNAENWEKWMTEFNDKAENYDEPQIVFIGLPRFKLEYEIDLENPLKALGMEVAFSKGADFSAMSPLPLWISFIKHKTFVEVNEEGTEAAAVTAGGGTRGGGAMIVDRPFFCAIRDDRTGAILFMGSIVDPNYK